MFGTFDRKVYKFQFLNFCLLCLQIVTLFYMLMCSMKLGDQVADLGGFLS